MKTNSDQIIADKILQYADLTGTRVLEVGCGNGRVTRFLADLPAKLVAVDPDEKQIRSAGEQVTGASFQIGSGEDLSFPDACFDRVVFTLSLHHQDSVKALSEAGRVLKNRGWILVVEPVAEGEVEQVFALVHNENREKLLAENAVRTCGIPVARSEIFHAQWIFNDKHDLCESLFDYYGEAYDPEIAGRILSFVGDKAEEEPLVLKDTMIIHVLKKEGKQD